MFDPNKWIKEAPKPEDSTFILGEETVKIRRLTGLQWEAYQKALQNTGESPTVTVLLHGVVNELTGGPFPEETMAGFYDACPIQAGKLANEILRITRLALQKEAETMEQAEKNLKRTGTNTSDETGASSTDSTREQQKSSGKN